MFLFINRCESTSESASVVQKAKRLRSLRKKLRQIRHLEDRIKSGEVKNLNMDQMEKLLRKGKVLKEIEILQAELDVSPSQQQHQGLQQQQQLNTSSGFCSTPADTTSSQSKFFAEAVSLLSTLTDYVCLLHGVSDPPVTETLPTETTIDLLENSLPTEQKTAEEVLSRYLETTAPLEEVCCICFHRLSGPSSYGEGEAGEHNIVRLSKCGHMFHRLCLTALYDSGRRGNSLQCPTCSTVYGELLGDCPPGEMSYDILPLPLPGHPRCRTIRVNYTIPPGTQGPEHANPGQGFTARGFPRFGFLPDTNKGRRVLRLLMVAWRRRLTFTVGTSASTGESDTVIWGGIHHKTEFRTNCNGHGYPDPDYLDDVTVELALQGVTEDDL
ncbi:E3 ubiquitin-protein ligase DTX4-like [Babylonia areolata]|uniref:E3 ubiquitin-protein ligase DTX4-like n=1 Tax=Babylonia areolata TaxID=304850 RepID=UPI003FD59FD5